MAWFIAAVVVAVSLVYLAGFRKTALGFLVAASIGGISLYLYNEHREQQATTRIAESQVVLENVEFRQTFGASYELSGKVKNNSETDVLDGIEFKVTMRDCRSKDKSSCVTIGEAMSYVSVAVPPKEARDFLASLYFGSTPKVKGTLAWDYEITALTAKQ